MRKFFPRYSSGAANCRCLKSLSYAQRRLLIFHFGANAKNIRNSGISSLEPIFCVLIWKPSLTESVGIILSIPSLRQIWRRPAILFRTARSLSCAGKVLTDEIGTCMCGRPQNFQKIGINARGGNLQRVRPLRANSKHFSRMRPLDGIGAIGRKFSCHRAQIRVAKCRFSRFFSARIHSAQW